MLRNLCNAFLLTAVGISVLSTVVSPAGFTTSPNHSNPHSNLNSSLHGPSVIILGGGVAGIIAARTLYERGIHNFRIIDARDELGGRLKSRMFGSAERTYRMEIGANWVHGTEAPVIGTSGGGPLAASPIDPLPTAVNPIWELVQKWNVQTRYNDYFGSMTTYDYTGHVDFLDLFERSGDEYRTLVEAAGAHMANKLTDTTARIGYSLSNSATKTQDHRELASEYYRFDWEYAQSPEQTSWTASAWAANNTFNAGAGGFSEDNFLSIDERGFATFIKMEAAEFLEWKQVFLNTTVTDIAYPLDENPETGLVNVTAILPSGVLQHEDVGFSPALPEWKRNAIHGMAMTTYTKMFLQFPEKFWFETEMGLYADRVRGRYPVWQSLDHVQFFPGSGILFVTVTGDYSQRIESLTDEQAKSEILEVLKSMYPNTTIPEPLDFFFERWGSDPLFRGSYTNWPASFSIEEHNDLRARVGDRLWFAGEATSQKYFGYLHGAYYEGVDVGKKLADWMERESSVPIPETSRTRL